MCMVKMKGFKISLKSDITKRKGIACQNLADLKSKIRNKFSCEEPFFLFTEDGTEVDDDEYLMSLTNNSRIIISKEQVMNVSISDPATNLFDQILTLLRWSGNTKDVYQDVLELMQEDFSTKWTLIKENVVKSEKDQSHLSTKQEDPDWFQDLSTTAKTKEEFMFKNCQSRIRGYLSRSETQISEFKMNKTETKAVTQILENFKSKLKENKYHGWYFDRSSLKEDRLCNKHGVFNCEGRYCDDECKYAESHLINPYSNYESRILFSTWNLDHGVERSRSILPSLLEAVQRMNKKQKLNVEYFYNLLFTRENLRLVHIVCHDKQEHLSMKCDAKKFYAK